MHFVNKSFMLGEATLTKKKKINSLTVGWKNSRFQYDCVSIERRGGKTRSANLNSPYVNAGLANNCQNKPCYAFAACFQFQV